MQIMSTVYEYTVPITHISYIRKSHYTSPIALFQLQVVSLCCGPQSASDSHVYTQV